MEQLRFLADESCDFAVVRALRQIGYDVLAISEVTQRSIDKELIQQANREQRILLTEDKDFGWLVFASHEHSPGVILIRYPGNARTQLATDIIRLIQTQAKALPGAFVVLQPGQFRFSRRPNSA